MEDTGVIAEVGCFDVGFMHSHSFEFTSEMVLFSDTPLNDDMQLQLFEERERRRERERGERE